MWRPSWPRLAWLTTSATRPSTRELVRQLAEGVGVALKGDEVAPLLRQDAVFQTFAIAVLEEATNGVLARMTKRRIAQIMRQAGRGHDGLNVGLTLLQIGVFFG